MVQSGYESTTITTLLTIATISLVTILLLKYIKWELSRQNMYRLANLMHTFPLRSVPFIGHGYHYMGDNEHILTTILRLGNSPTPIAAWLGPILLVHISHPEDLEKVLNNPHAITKSHLYDFTRVLLGDGIFVSTGSKWKKHKKLIMSTFSQKNLNGFVEIFVKNTNVLLEILETKQGVTDLSEVMASLSLDVICETVLGVEINSQKSNCKFAEYLQRMMDLVAKRIFNIWLHPNFIYYLTPMYYEQQNIVKYIKNFSKDVLTKKREEITVSKHLDAPFQDAEETSKNKLFLEILLEMANNGTILTEQEILDEVYTFLVAGFDTSSTATNFVLLMLAMFPEIQRKVYEEVIDILGPGREVEISDLPKMVFLERVIKETMRIFPVGPIVGRTAEEDIKLESYTIPKGAQIALTIINTHRNPEYFKDPLKFDPDRFLPEEVAKRHPYSYLPFTAGIRKCIGVKYADMFMKTLLSKLVRKFTLETPYKSIEEIRLKEALVLKTVDGFPIKLKLRY